MKFQHVSVDNPDFDTEMIRSARMDLPFQKAEIPIFATAYTFSLYRKLKKQNGKLSIELNTALDGFSPLEWLLVGRFSFNNKTNTPISICFCV